MEHKFLPLEIKAEDDGTISGYGSVFNVKDQGGDMLVPGAFKSSLTKSLPKMLWQHDPRAVIGVWTKAAEDSKGLHVEGRVLPEVAKGAEALALLRAKAIDGLSIGYITKDYEIEGAGHDRLRKLKEVTLPEVSIVTFPMNTEATVTDVKQLSGPREVETLLREAGVPGTFAKLVALYGYDEAKSRLKTGRREGADLEATEDEVRDLLTKLQTLKEKIHV